MPFINGQLATDGPVIDIFVGVSHPRLQVLQAAGQSVPNPIQARALVDTGASGTVIDKKVIQSLGITPTGSVAVHTPSTGSSPQAFNQYDVSVWFAQPQAKPPYQLMGMIIPVVEADFSAQTIQALIGRDLLARCVLVYNGVTGSITLCY